MTRNRSSVVCLTIGLLGIGTTGCRAPLPDEGHLCDEGAKPLELSFNEVVSNNEGNAIDHTGATDDWIELSNNGNRSINLGLYEIEHGGGRTKLPAFTLPPRERLMLWADGEPEQGSLHLDFRVSSASENLRLTTCGATIDRAAVPTLAENETFARHPDGTGDQGICRYATPGESNGEACTPPEPRGLVDEVTFLPYEFFGPHPPLAHPIAISEAALRPADYVELGNTSDQDVSLEGYSLRLAPIFPGEPLPNATAGIEIALGDVTVGAGELMTFAVTVDDVAELEQDPLFEGVLSLFGPDGQAVDRWDFMRFPQGAILARPDNDSGLTQFCEEGTPGEENVCAVLESRDVGDRVRAIRTRGDFAALAEGGTSLGTSAVKFVVDVAQGGSVHFLRAEDWALHYTFIRETIEGHEPLDRCNPAERALFNQGWYEFSLSEYFSTEGRSYFLGTLVKHGSSGHQTVEFALGDTILSSDIKETFFTVTSRVPDATSYAFRPQDDSQVTRAQRIDGELPIVGPNAPFADLVYQPLTHGVGYGVLTWVPASELESTPLGSQVILVTDDVPNDIPLVGGLITQAFQTPLAHVNVLSQNRGTPNMAHRHASDDPRITEHLGQLVRLTVSGDDFQIELADPDDAAAFWEMYRPDGPLEAPRLDTSVRELVDLKDASLESIPIIGAKASQLAEIYRVVHSGPSVCSGQLDFDVPDDGFAIPVAFFREHFAASGARETFDEVRAEDDFVSDPLVRAARLADIQGLIMDHPVDPDLLSMVEAQLAARFGTRSVRFRSSSNAEDLPGFNGAGLYTSTSAEIGDPERPADLAIRTVWASLFNPRAYDERELARVDHDQVAMGVLVHEAFPSEAANGVAVSRNVLDPIRGDIYYINSQAGEAAVTNPAPGVTTEALEFQWPPRRPLLTYQSQSSLIEGTVLSHEEAIGVACALEPIHRHFRPLLDPEGADPWFAMEIEFKLLYPSRRLIVKQARPHAFSGFDIAGDCREL